MFEFKFLGLLATLFFNDPVVEVQTKIKEISSRPTAAIQPIPDFQNNVLVNYEASQNRDPFYGKSLHREISLYKPVKVFINNNRPKQELENYPINQLVMAGVLRKGKSFDVMIRNPEGLIVVASIGDYIGENHGRIKQIKPEVIEFAEAIDDGQGGYVERLGQLALMENHKAEGF